MPTSPLGSLPRTQSLPSSSLTDEQRPALQRSASMPASDSGLRSRTDNLRTAGAEFHAGAAPLAPRNLALKTLSKHTFGALMHGAASVLHAVSRRAHEQVSSYSGPASALANAYGLAGEMTRPLSKNEGATAWVHLQGMQLAAKDLLNKTHTYDAGAIAQQLSGLKAQKHALQADKKEVLASGSQVPLPAAAPGTRSLAAVGPYAVMARTHKPTIAATKAAATALHHAVAGSYHKAKEGMHLMGAKARTGAPTISHAHQMAKISHSARAAMSFADASVQAKHAAHYATLSARAQTARAARTFVTQSERFSHTALAQGLTGIKDHGKAALDRVVQRLLPKLAQLAHQRLSRHAIPAYKPTPNDTPARPKPVAPEGERL